MMCTPTIPECIGLEHPSEMTLLLEVQRAALSIVFIINLSLVPLLFLFEAFKRFILICY